MSANIAVDGEAIWRIVKRHALQCGKAKAALARGDDARAGLTLLFGSRAHHPSQPDGMTIAHRR